MGRAVLASAHWGTAVVWGEGTGLWEEAGCSAGEARRMTGIPAVRQRDIRLCWLCCGESILKDMLNSHILHRPIRHSSSPVPLTVDYLHCCTYQNFRSEKESVVWKSWQNSDNWACSMDLPAVKQEEWENPVTTSGTIPTMLTQRDPRNVKWNNNFLFSLFRQVNLGLHCIPFMLCD